MLKYLLVFSLLIDIEAFWFCKYNRYTNALIRYNFETPMQHYIETNYEAKICVCTSKSCQDRGSDATMATFTFLAPENISVCGVNCLGLCNKGPNVRVLFPNETSVEVMGTGSVDGVVNVFNNILNFNVNMTSADVLRLNYRGNMFLREGDLESAIKCYDSALSFDDKSQEGILLLMRGTAYLQRSYVNRLRFRDLFHISQKVIPNFEALQDMLWFWALCFNKEFRPRIMLGFLTKLAMKLKRLDTLPMWNNLKQSESEGRELATIRNGEELLQKLNFYWGSYRYSIFKSLDDLLLATKALPGFAQVWRRAGDALLEIEQYPVAIQYYEIATELDIELKGSLDPVIEKLLNTINNTHQETLSRKSENAKSMSSILFDE